MYVGVCVCGGASVRVCRDVPGYVIVGTFCGNLYETFSVGFTISMGWPRSSAK